MTTTHDAAQTAPAGELTISAGEPHPLGAHLRDSGVNFAVFSQHADAVTLLLFADPDDPEPMATVPLTRTFHVWHAHVAGIGENVGYAFRVQGPELAEHGFRFNPQRVLIDPYARANSSSLWDRGRACERIGDDDISGVDNLETSMRSVVVRPSSFDWQGDRPPRRPMADSVIYEMHVRGFTAHPSAGVANAGTYLGVVEKIPYLQSLGVTAVELLPVFEFDGQDILRHNGAGEPLRNYWGYSTMSFFAPHSAYASGGTGTEVLDEFRTMVRELHKAGIEVILDVVFNHTDEGQHQGPAFSFKGFDNPNYYHLVQVTASTTWITRAAAIRSTAITPSAPASSWIPSTIGSPRCTSTASGSTKEPS